MNIRTIITLERFSIFALMKSKTKVLIAALFALFVAALLTLLNHFGQLSMQVEVVLSIRWMAIAVLAIYIIMNRTLTGFIMLFMVIGIETGHDFKEFALNLKVLSDIFLRLIKTIIAPLLFGTLVFGIAGHANLKQVGRMSVKALVYFEIVTTLALFIGLFAINISKAGVGAIVPAGVKEEVMNIKPQSATEIILHIFPENFAKAIVEGQVLQVVVFSILFGIGLALVREEKRKPMVALAESLSEVMFKFTNIVMYFAPIAVGGAIAYTVSKYGLDIFGNLLKLLLTLYVSLVAFVLLVLLPVALIIRIPIVKFIKAVTEPVTIAFATASSESALPIAMEEMEKFGVPRKIVSFVLPTGYSFNLDGTTLYLSLASVFVAQAAGIEMTFGQQLVMVFTLMLTSKGVAGVPRASLVILAATVSSFNLPPEPIFIIMGIDTFLDMARTSVNVLGNCLASVVVAKWEGELVV